MVFGVQFMRAMVDALAVEGFAPTDSWLRQSWRAYSGRPNPSDERESPIYNENPRAIADRADVPAIAEALVAAIQGWGDYLGFTLGVMNSGLWRECTPDTEKYIV